MRLCALLHRRSGVMLDRRLFLADKYSQENGLIPKLQKGAGSVWILSPGFALSLRTIHEAPSSAANWVSRWQLVDQEGMQSLGEEHARDWIKLRKVLSMTSQLTRPDFEATRNASHVNVVAGTKCSTADLQGVKASHE